MTNNIFKKAKIQYFSSYISYEGTGRSKEHFSIKDNDSLKEHAVNIEKSENGSLFSCDCTFSSLPKENNLNMGRQPLCSHILTAILFKCGRVKMK